VKLLHLLCVAASFPLCRAATPSTDLIYGHYEIHVDYSATPGNPDAGWRFSVSYDEDDDFSTSGGVVRLDPEATTIVAAPATGLAVPSPAGVFARFGSPGTPLWVLPQNNVTGTPFLGVRTTMSAGLFQARVGNNYSPSSQGSVSLRLVSVEGTGADAGGKFATWKNESFGSAVFSFDSTDGISAADEIPTIPVSSHTHYNWAFTKPGLYRVTFEAKGKLMPAHGGVLTSARRTFLFAVPFSSRAGDGARLGIAADESGLRMSVADPTQAVAYAPDRVMLEAGVAAGPAASALSGAIWQSIVTVATDASPLPNAVGISPATASSGLASGEWDQLVWTITGVRGPGNFALIRNGSLLATKQGGDIALQSSSNLGLTATFTATGIYRIDGFLEGRRSGLPVVGRPFTITFGAGLTANFSYATWQASFEQTAGLPAGTLSDPEADLDQDGLANGVEFALFWHGLDPTRADAALMPRPSPGGISFLRDTYKDPLDESGWQIRPAYSSDLKSWQIRSSRVPGFPLGLFESEAEEGNARGRILQRRLRVVPSPPRAFFRFDVTTP
jgi:surface-anchored protein